jgi:iron complex outermembrane receptor protein
LKALFLLVLAALCLAQEPQHETIVVTGTYEPVPLEEADRSVVALPVRDQTLTADTWLDFLRLDPSLDIRERAPGGVQTDLSIRGGTFGQTLILLNGLRLDDPQSGHHDMDLPVPLESIERIEVLRGSGSTLYGSDAVDGAVNVITQPPEGTEFRLRAAAGNFGVNQERGELAGTLGKVSEQVVFSRDFSSGFMPDRDYRNLSLASSTHLVSPLGGSDITLGYADKPFGADQFYGNYPSWEDTKTWFASWQQALGENTSASFGFRRHSDLYVLYRDDPEIYTNHHEDESWQIAVRQHEQLAANTALYYGVEGFHDSIASTNLGEHARWRGAAYTALDVRALRRFSFTLGAREEVYRNFAGDFSPTASAGYWFSQHLKLRGSVSHAFRVPSYTDLYYHDPGNLGNPALRPERAWSYESGLEWIQGRRFTAQATVFRRLDRDGIDYVRTAPDGMWQAENIDRLNFTGVEAGVSVKAHRGHQLDFRYTGLHGSQNLPQGIQSKYVFNYPSQAGVGSWLASLPGGVLLRTRVGVTQRRAQPAYALWDVYAAGTRGRVHPFLQLTNLADVSYQEIPGVWMPGRAVVGGLEWLVLRGK